MAKSSAKAKTKAKSKPVQKTAKAKAKKPAVKAKAKVKPAPKAKMVKPKAARGKIASKTKTAVKVAAGAVALGAAAFAAKALQASKGSSKSSVKLENISAIFSPLDDRLIVEAVEAATRTAGGLYIPDTVDGDDRPKQGKVLAVGRGHLNKKGRLQPLDVKLGDTVVFESYVGSPIKIGSRDCFVLRESQLLGVVKS